VLNRLTRSGPTSKTNTRPIKSFLLSYIPCDVAMQAIPTNRRIVDGGRLPFSPISLIQHPNDKDSSNLGFGSSNSKKYKHHRVDNRHLGSNDEDYSSYLVDKDGNEYEPYSLAWRYLGMYIDCDDADQEESNEDDQESDDEKRRFLEEEDNGDDSGNCERVLLWAAVS
jgi:hypothetical protein